MNLVIFFLPSNTVQGVTEGVHCEATAVSRNAPLHL